MYIYIFTRCTHTNYIKIKNSKINQTYIYDNKDTLSKNEI